MPSLPMIAGDAGTPAVQEINIAIISTGGTFGMETSERGLRPAPVAERIDALLRSPAIPGLAYTVTELAPQIDSANATPLAWQQIVDAIDERYEHFDGFVIVHGTDTMAYSAAAVAFAFSDRHKPIVFTGAQRPLSSGDSDGPLNLIGAIEHLMLTRPQTADIYFGGVAMNGTRAVKYSTTADRAFISATTAQAESSAAISAAEPAAIRSIPPFGRYSDVEIPVIRVYPGISARTMSAMLGDLPAAVLECYGYGNMPAATPGLLDAIAAASGRGQVIVAVSQCVDGRITLGRSEVSTGLVEAGVVDGVDLTTEAALAKLHYLFGCGLSAPAVRELVAVGLAGELTTRV
ncbi:MAG: L-asparaginase [Microbacteriaceae bacterium]|nr:L-asparaginase [Microbacteriaceae bacterium]